MKEGERFAFGRFADGEWAIMHGQEIQTADGWTVPSRKSPVSQLLNAAFNHDCQGYYLGISCPCCQPQLCAQQHFRLAGRNYDRITFSNLFVNGNYSKWKSFVIDGGFIDGCAVVSSGRGDYPVPAAPDAVNKEWDYLDLASQLRKEQRPILVAAGPIGEILVYAYWRNTPPSSRQTIIDVGSSCDEWIHDRPPNRSYAIIEGHPNRRKACIWVPQVSAGAADPVGW
jgi:hypothetical protein